jgi:phospholipid-binding lipoprotein MlaA
MQLTMKKLFVTLLVLAASSNPADAATVLKKTHFPPAESCSGMAAGEPEEGAVSDPLEPLNRRLFKTNRILDGMFFKPASMIYRGVVPQWGRDRVSNVVYNISEPVTVVNSVFQGDAENAFTATWRFLINTTFGLLGTFDAASELGLEPRKEDFGQTLSVWGVGSGPYIVLPILGPSNLRDTVGMAADVGANPLLWGKYTDTSVRVSYAVARAIDARTKLLDVTNDIDRTSLDPYASYRSLYNQKRDSDISNGN